MKEAKEYAVFYRDNLREHQIWRFACRMNKSATFLKEQIEWMCLTGTGTEADMKHILLTKIRRQNNGIDKPLHMLFTERDAAAVAVNFPDLDVEIIRADGATFQPREQFNICNEDGDYAEGSFLKRVGRQAGQQRLAL